MQDLKNFIEQQMIAMKDKMIKEADFLVALNPDGTVTTNSLTTVRFTITLRGDMPN